MQDSNENNIDLSAETESDRDLLPEKEPWHPEKARMRLAYIVLIGIFIIFILTLISNFLAHQGYIDLSLSNSLFEFCKTGLLPIVTLILGFYFSKSN